MNTRNLWTQEEIDTLKQRFPGGGKAAVFEALGGRRTKAAIQVKAVQLGVTQTGTRKPRPQAEQGKEPQHQDSIREQASQPGEVNPTRSGDEDEANNAIAGTFLRLAKGIEESNRHMVNILNRFGRIDKLEKEMKLLKYELELRSKE
jgi:hypothetical protein